MSRIALLSRPFMVAAVVLAFTGCAADSPTELSYEATNHGIQIGSVTVTPTASGLSVVNQTERPVYLFAVNAESLALLDWAPCAGGSACPPLAQGATRNILWSDVYSYTPNVKQFTVYWWNVTVQSDGVARADNVHNVTVTR